MRSIASVALFAAALAACGGKDAAPNTGSGGTIVFAAGQEPGALLPPLAQSTADRQVIDAVFGPLAVAPDTVILYSDAGYTPHIADRWEWSTDSLSLAFHIRPTARWEDGKPIVAEDLQYSFSVYQAPSIGAGAASQFTDIDSVSVRDSATAVVWYNKRSATQFYDFTYNFIPFPKHVYGKVPVDSLPNSELSRTVVGSGPFKMTKWERGVRLEVIADTANWNGRPTLDRVVWSFAQDPITLATQLKAGEADFLDFIRPNALADFAGDTMVRLIRRPALDYGLAQFNTRARKNASSPHPIFGEAGTRRAIAMAIDRAKLIQNAFDTLAAVSSSPYLSFHNIGDIALPAYDVEAAKQLLDSLGWKDSNGDGVRERRGTKLEFQILVPSSSTPRSAMAIVMQESMRAIGANASVGKVEGRVMGAALTGGDFDLALMGYSGDLNPAFIRQLWETNAGQNFGKFSNAMFDAAIDSGASAISGSEARRHFAAAGALLARETPAIWLFELSPVSGVHHRVRVVGVRRDAWWAGLARWTIDPAQRIDRDRIGLRAP